MCVIFLLKAKSVLYKRVSKVMVHGFHRPLVLSTLFVVPPHRF